jgi:hypothetical protein
MERKSMEHKSTTTPQKAYNCDRSKLRFYQDKNNSKMDVDGETTVSLVSTAGRRLKELRKE